MRRDAGHGTRRGCDAATEARSDGGSCRTPVDKSVSRVCRTLIDKMSTIVDSPASAGRLSTARALAASDETHGAGRAVLRKQATRSMSRYSSRAAESAEWSRFSGFVLNPIYMYLDIDMYT